MPVDNFTFVKQEVQQNAETEWSPLQTTVLLPRHFDYRRKCHVFSFLSKDAFRKLVLEPLTHGVTAREAAELIAKDETPDLIKAFSLERFNDFRLLDDKAATAASH